MSAISSLRDLQSIQALAHDLYAHCQRPSSAFRPIAKSLRALRNKLEEADEALDDATVRPEAVLVLYATGKSREVLEEINRLVDEHDGEYQSESTPAVAHILIRLNEVTAELSSTLQALSTSTETMDMLLDTSFRGSAYATSAGSRASSVASMERLRSASPRSITQSSSTARTSVSDWLSLSRLATLPNPPGGSAEVTRNHSLPSVTAIREKESLASISQTSTPEAWQSPFGSPDPMSTSIDTASTLILRTESTELQDERCEKLFHASTNDHFVGKFDNEPVNNSAVPSLSDELDRALIARRHPSALRPGRNVTVDPMSNNLTHPTGLGLRRQSASSRKVNPYTTDDPAHTEQRSPDGRAERQSPSTTVSKQYCHHHGSSEAVVSDSQRPLNTIHHRIDSAPSDRHGLGTRKLQPAHPAINNPLAIEEIQTTTALRQSEILTPDTVSSRPSTAQRPLESCLKDADTLPADRSLDRSEQVSQGMPVRSRYRARKISTPPDPVYDYLDSQSQFRVPAERHHATNIPDKLMPAATEPAHEVQSQQWAEVDPHGSPEPVMNHWDTKEIQRAPGTLEVDVTKQRHNLIVQHWNNASWVEAEIVIREVLGRNSGDRHLCRRLQYLLGVISSLTGDWIQALESFILVLQQPIHDASQLDSGSCAAAYWLGDTYALLGRRSEALLAYAIAEQSPFFHGPERQRAHQHIRAEQAACQSGSNRAAVKLEMDRKMQKKEPCAPGSIFDTAVLTVDAAKGLLNTLAWPPEKHELDPDQSRIMTLGNAGLPSQSWEDLHRLQIRDAAQLSSSPWPIPFDPHFAMINISSRQQAEACDLLHVMSSKKAPKIPKAGAMTRKGMNSFSCPEVLWLITTIRQCLSRLKMNWTEYLTPQETGFAAHYEAVDAGIATMYYFNIAIFRPTFRPGYIAEVCPDGMCSARIRRGEPNTEKGVHQEEVKRIKKRIREYLEAALVRQDTIDMKGMAMPVVSANGATGMHRRVSVKAVRQASSPGSSMTSRPESVRS